jgi:disulfide bond formation protein DsbB
MLGSFPLADALPMIFHGAGDCSKIDWSFLGLSLANWSLVTFTVVALFALAMIVRKPT